MAECSAGLAWCSHEDTEVPDRTVYHRGTTGVLTVQKRYTPGEVLVQVACHQRFGEPPSPPEFSIEGYPLDMDLRELVELTELMVVAAKLGVTSR
jgi:hypothetical protein